MITITKESKVEFFPKLRESCKVSPAVLKAVTVGTLSGVGFALILWLGTHTDGIVLWRKTSKALIRDCNMSEFKRRKAFQELIANGFATKNDNTGVLIVNSECIQCISDELA